MMSGRAPQLWEWKPKPPVLCLLMGRFIKAKEYYYRALWLWLLVRARRRQGK